MKGEFRKQLRKPEHELEISQNEIFVSDSGYFPA